MSVNLYNQLEWDKGYRLLQVTDDLLEALKKGPVKLKALSTEHPDVVLCSESKTWLVKQKNHSNTVLVMKEFVPTEEINEEVVATFGLQKPTSSWCGFSIQDSELEPRLIPGAIDITRLDVYDGKDVRLTRNIGLADFRETCPCSIEEFNSKWSEIGGSIIQGSACILSSGFILKALHIVLISCLAENLDVDNLELDAVRKAVTKDVQEGEFTPYTDDVIDTVVHKFGLQLENATDRYKINMPLVATYYGISALKKFASSEVIAEDEFMIQWKSQFPPYFHCDLDIKMLRGNFVRPLPERIRYLSRHALSPDVKERFRQLFHWQSSWILDDLVPFIEELNGKGIKIENFVMKYARKKKVGNNILVTSR